MGTWCNAKRNYPEIRYLTTVYRYRLIDDASGADLGPFVSTQSSVSAGWINQTWPPEQLELVNVVAPENENFRAYLIVRRP